MPSVQTRHAIHPTQITGMSQAEISEHFATKDMFASGEIRLVYTHYDRFVMGGAVPGGTDLVLDAVAETGTPSFLDRREMAVVNIGGAGQVSARGHTYDLGRGDVLYLGRGAGAVTFSGQGRFYIASAPAHANYPDVLVPQTAAKRLELGSSTTANERVIYQVLVPGIVETCQLVLGYTLLAPGSVWNTMPAHIHDRRMEAYLYFDVADDARVMHLLGAPDNTRHVFLANEQGALSPPWSIHAGAGTGAYGFIWAMAGDNMDYTDQDFLKVGDLV